MRGSKLVLAGFAALFLCVVNAGAQTPQPPDTATLRAEMGDWVTKRPGFSFPANRAELDRLLDSRKFAELTVAMRAMTGTPDGILGLLNWQLFRIMTGGGYWITNQYAVTLWNVGLANAREGRPIADGYKSSAVRYATYAMAIVEIDSLGCMDQTAGPKHRERLLNEGAALWAYAKTMPQPLREKILLIVIDMESKLAPLREQDNDLCRYGDEEMLAALGNKDLRDAADCKHVEGLPGKTCDIVMPKDYTPKRRDPSEMFFFKMAGRLTLINNLSPLLDSPQAK